MKDYIDQMRDLGHHDDQIKEQLTSAGWPEEHVHQHLAATPNGNSNNVKEENEQPAETTTPQALPYITSPFGLLSQSIDLLRGHAVALFIWAIITVILTGMGAFLGVIVGTFLAPNLARSPHGGLTNLLLFITVYLVIVNVFVVTARTVTVKAILSIIRGSDSTGIGVLHTPLHILWRSYIGNLIFLFKLIGLPSAIILVMGSFYGDSIYTAFFLSASPTGMIVLLILSLYTLLTLIRNAFLQQTLVELTDVPIYKSSATAYDVLRKPKDKSLEIIGWFFWIGLPFWVIWSVADSASQSPALEVQAQVAITVIISIAIVLFQIVFDIGLTYIYASSVDLIRFKLEKPKASWWNKGILIVVALLLTLLAILPLLALA